MKDNNEKSTDKERKNINSSCPLNTKKVKKQKSKKASINSIEDLLEDLAKKNRKEKEKRLTQQKIKNILRNSNAIQFTHYIDIQRAYPLKPPKYVKKPKTNAPSAAMENGEENIPLSFEHRNPIELTEKEHTEQTILEKVSNTSTDFPINPEINTQNSAEDDDIMHVRMRLPMQDYHFYTHIIEHGLTVASYVHMLFIGLEPLHGLDRKWLHRLLIAAQYHDVGAIDGDKSHHKHSYHRLKTNFSIVIPQEDREMVALLARYHRRAMPSKKHKEFACLSLQEQAQFCKAASILRVADALDYRHQGIIKKVDVYINQSSITLECHSQKSLTHEKLRVQKKGDLFVRTFKKEIECKQV